MSSTQAGMTSNTSCIKLHSSCVQCSTAAKGRSQKAHITTKQQQPPAGAARQHRPPRNRPLTPANALSKELLLVCQASTLDRSYIGNLEHCQCKFSASSSQVECKHCHTYIGHAENRDEECRQQCSTCHLSFVARSAHSTALVVGASNELTAILTYWQA